MDNNMIKKGFIAEGTTCDSCTAIIKRQAKKVDGVKEVEFDYATELGSVVFDQTKTDIDDILYKIEEKGYSCYILDEKKGSSAKASKTMGTIIAIIGVIVVGYFLINFAESVPLPEIGRNTGYGLLFAVGLLTGFHCVAMCGGFVVSYTAKDAKHGRTSHKSHIKYAIGKTLSYTIIGAAFGLLGSIIAFTPAMRGFAGIFAGLFLVLFGLKMLNIIPALRRLSIRLPKEIAKFVGQESGKNQSNPLVIGLLNGLMIACGPLQAIYIMAAGTGSMIEGAKLLFVFAVGTLPVMIAFGFFASFISGRLTAKILKASGVLVIVLGLVMLNNGLVLTGSGYDFGSVMQTLSSSDSLAATGSTIAAADDSNIAAVRQGFQEIRMDVTRYGWEPDTFVLQKDIPVKWIINGKEITGCNNAIQVPKYNLQFDIKPGEQVIEFTPTEEGVIRWSCWMGMIPGTFIVKENAGTLSNEDIEKEIAAVPQAAGGSCGGSCGSPSCGAATGGSCGCGA
ncbi:MAG: sulfite exporter TauE/SafE family protein [Nanoarchaeota archaeon]|nr:sulfite exporter TauE/SafE family protein [Nanoarchaeota archaeon]